MTWHINYICYHIRLEILHIQCHNAAQWSAQKLRTTKPTHAHFDFHFLFLHYKKIPYFQPETYLQVGKFSSY